MSPVIGKAVNPFIVLKMIACSKEKGGLLITLTSKDRPICTLSVRILLMRT